MHEGMTIAFRF